MYEEELGIAIDCVESASRLCREAQPNIRHRAKTAKKDESPVTSVDLASQIVIGMKLLKAFPDDAVIGEEDSETFRMGGFQDETIRLVQKQCESSIAPSDIGKALRSDGKRAERRQRFWTIDPIDGTKGFLRGRQYAIALALVLSGEAVVGVLGCPNLPADSVNPGGETGCICYAAKNLGTFLKAFFLKTPQKINVNSIRKPETARFCESYEKDHFTSRRTRESCTKVGYY